MFSLPGGTLVGGLVDLGDGRYVQEVETEPGNDVDPGISVGQPDRPPVVVVPPTRQRAGYRYVTPLVCGVESGECCECASVVQGRFATALTAYNATDREAVLILIVVPTTFAGATSGRWPDSVPKRAQDRIILKPGEATTIDCCSVSKLLLGAPAPSNGALTFGVLALESNVKVDVSVTYTVVTKDGASPAIDVDVLVPSEFRVREARQRPPQPEAPPAKTRQLPPPRPQDVPKQRKQEERPGLDESHAKQNEKKPAGKKG